MTSIIRALIGRFRRILKPRHRIRALGIPASLNDLRLWKLKNVHKGKRAFIIGSGPSLASSDLEKLADEITFGCNRQYVVFGQTRWRPTYYSIIDFVVAETNRPEIEKLNLSKIFSQSLEGYFSTSSDIVWIRSLPAQIQNGTQAAGFSTNLFHGFWGGWTVIYAQLQIAFWMGIRDIYLLGVDFEFTVPHQTVELVGNEVVIRSEGETNHFHPEYRRAGDKWTTPKLELQYQALKLARSIFEHHGGHISNASRRTALDVFPLVDLEDVLG